MIAINELIPRAVIGLDGGRSDVAKLKFWTLFGKHNAGGFLPA
jgi:hypothetical protein